MDRQPAAVAKTECVAERNGVDGRAAAAGADDLARRDGDSGRRECDGQVLEMSGGGRRLRSGMKAGKALAACFNDAARADSNKIRRHKAAGLLRGLCVQPLVFDLADGRRSRLGVRR